MSKLEKDHVLASGGGALAAGARAPRSGVAVARAARRRDRGRRRRRARGDRRAKAARPWTGAATSAASEIHETMPYSNTGHALGGLRARLPVRDHQLQRAGACSRSPLAAEDWDRGGRVAAVAGGTRPAVGTCMARPRRRDQRGRRAARRVTRRATAAVSGGGGHRSASSCATAAPPLPWPRGLFASHRAAGQSLAVVRFEVEPSTRKSTNAATWVTATLPRGTRVEFVLRAVSRRARAAPGPYPRTASP